MTSGSPRQLEGSWMWECRGAGRPVSLDARGGIETAHGVNVIPSRGSWASAAGSGRTCCQSGT